MRSELPVGVRPPEVNVSWIEFSEEYLKPNHLTERGRSYFIKCDEPQCQPMLKSGRQV